MTFATSFSTLSDEKAKSDGAYRRLHFSDNPPECQYVLFRAENKVHVTR